MKKNYRRKTALMLGLLMPITGAHALTLPPISPKPPLNPPLCYPNEKLVWSGEGLICVPDDIRPKPPIPAAPPAIQQKTAEMLEAISEINLTDGAGALNKLFEDFGTQEKSHAAPGTTRNMIPRGMETKPVLPRKMHTAAYDSCFDGNGNCPKPPPPPRPTPPPAPPRPTPPPPPEIPPLPPSTVRPA